MKTRNIFGTVAIMALAIFSSCSKEDVKTNNDVVTLEVAGLQQLNGESNQSQSRTSFELEGVAPKVKWIKGDEIYIGYINPKLGAGKPLTTFIGNENLIKFTCKSVDENNVATFEGASIPDNANIAVYTLHPENVFNHYRSKGDGSYGVKSSVNAVAIDGENNTHLAESDVLISKFNNSVIKFQRMFALAKFDFTLPEVVTETTGTFSCDRFKMQVRAAIPAASEEPIFIDNSGAFENITIPVNGNKISFYSLIPKVTIKDEGNGTKITYTIKIGENTYTAEKDYGRVEITPTSALEFKATLTKK